MPRSWVNDPQLRDELEERGQLYYQYEERTNRQMAKFSDYRSEGAFLKAAEIVQACKKANKNPLQFRKELTIREVVEHTFPARDDQAEQTKLVALFEGWPEDGRGLVLNAGNTAVLSDLCEDDTDKAPGKQVEFYLDVEPFSSCGYGMRLRPVGTAEEADDIPF